MPGIRIDGQYIPLGKVREIISHYDVGSSEKKGLQNVISMLVILGDQEYYRLPIRNHDEAGTALREYLRRKNENKMR